MRPEGLPALLIACAGFTGAAAAEFKDFRDWHAACDNLRNCSAYGFQADEPSYACVRVERSGAPAAAARVTIVVDAGAKATVALAFDDANLRGLPAGPVALERSGDDSLGRVAIDDPAAVDALIASLRTAQALVIRRIDPPDGEKSEQETSRISLSGAVAALLWIDEQQQRLGTATAFIRRGDKSASSIAPPPQAPVVHAAKPPPAGGAPKPLSPAETRAIIAKARALCNDDERASHDDAFRLGRDAVLHGFSCPGISGAYNQASVFLIAPDGKPQAARAVKFAYPAGIRRGGSTSDDVIAINAGFDQDSMTLSTFNKGRGLGDCGAAENWVWDGQTFQLVELRSMPHCKGVPMADWPVHYRAERK